MAHGVFHTKLGIKINLSLPDLGHPGRPELWGQLHGKVKRGDLECLECRERDPGCPQWMYLRVRRGRREACHFNTGIRHPGVPESPRHKALKERIARAADRAGFSAELESSAEDGRRRTDVLIRGARGLLLGCEVQLSHATAAAVVKRSDIARRDGLRPLWTTDDRKAPLIERTPWARVDHMPWQDIAKGSTMLVRGGVKTLETRRCDTSSHLPCPDRGYGRCGHWHGTWSPALGMYLDDLIGLTAAGEYVPLYLPRQSGRRRAAYLWVSIADQQRYEDAAGPASTTPKPGTVDDDDPADPVPQPLDSTCTWSPGSWSESDPLEGAVRDTGAALPAFTLRTPAPARPQSPAKHSTFLSYIAAQRHTTTAPPVQPAAPGRDAEPVAELRHGDTGAPRHASQNRTGVVIRVKGFEFPAELVHTQRELHRVRAERSQLLASFPSYAEASTRPETAEWAPGDPPLGRTREQAEQEHLLRKQETELAAQVHQHSFWATLSGPELVDARTALKHAEGAHQAE